MYFILMPAQINKPTQTKTKAERARKRKQQMGEQSEKRLQTGLAQLCNCARPSAINEAGWS